MQSIHEVIERILREYLHVPFEGGGKNPMVHCPWHDDATPSGAIIISESDAKFRCYACADLGTVPFERYVARVRKIDEKLAIQDMEQLYGYELGTILDADLIEGFHSHIWGNEQELLLRGITPQTIKRYRLGFNAGRITIPIYNQFGLFVNIRRYKPGADARNKMRNQRGCGKKPRLYPIDQLEYDKIVLCGGEIKALAATQQLNEHGIGAISTTSGEKFWPPEMNRHFEGKRVYVCYDIDKTGKESSRKVANTLSTVAEWVGQISLPLDTAKHPHGDVNDFIAEGGDMHALIETAQRWVPDYTKKQADNEVYPATLSQAVHAKFAAKRVRLQACVTAISRAPYSIPRTVRVMCDKSQDVCGACPIASTVGEPVREIPDESLAVLEMVDESVSKQKAAIKRSLDIPEKCPVVTFDVLEYHHVEDCRVSPPLSLDSADDDRELVPAMFIGSNVILNESYNIIARMLPHPRTQTTTLVAANYDTTEDALSQYTPQNPQELEIFRPDAWTVQEISKKLHSIYEDFAANVTTIFKRPDLHFVCDLAYHSPLMVRLRGKEEKGWVEVLIIGDSAQGKTAVTSQLMKHYRLGQLVDCKNATVAGLIGGLEQIDKRWFVKWGAIPVNDRRLVAMEELKGLSQELIGRMTEVRSSGMAQIPKIESRKKLARCRLIAVSNPRDSRSLESRAKGCLAIKDLVGGLEDIRRFDMCYGVSAREVDPELINRYQIDPPYVDHVYTSELCHKLVLHAWTIKNVVIEDEPYLLKRAMEFAKQYGSPDLPIVDAGSAKLKVLRLAAALAMRLFSTNDDYTVVIVRNCHVDYILEFLDRIYSGSALNYKSFVESKRHNDLRNPSEIEAYIRQIPHCKDFVDLMLECDGTFDTEDIAVWGGWDKDTAADCVSFLTRKRAIVKRGRRWLPSDGFIEMLKDIAASPPDGPVYEALEDEF